MSSWVNRVVGAAMLRSATYEEVEADKTANVQALAVVLVSAVAAGLSMADGGGRAIGFRIIGALVGWVLWAALAWLIGTKILPGPETHSDMGELLRTIGFASAPGILRILGGLPFVGLLFEVVAGLWMLAAFVVAVRQALDYQSTGRALLVCAIGCLVWFAVIAWTTFLAGATVAGIGLLQRGN
ncbi:MAG TPA: YIP1 family protein [Candidatus Limnocylindrales bacterium]|jgi:hypothetical protein|nr:YIP1 family protein [Candidatus Limnocylindrales bacterium]